MELLQKLSNSILKKLIFYIVLIIIWQTVYTVFVDLLKIWKFYNFPSPLGTAESIINMTKEFSLIIAVAVSLKRIIMGYIISIILGSVIGLILTKIDSKESGLNGLILGIQTLPNICWLPFAILWFGLNETSILFIVVIGSMFSVAIAFESGIKNVSPVYIKAGKNLGAKGIKLYRYVILPAAMPSIIAGMKQGWSFAWRGLIAGEMLSASKGLGQLLMTGRELADINQIAAVMIIIITVGIVVERVIFGNIEKRVLKRRGVN